MASNKRRSVERNVDEQSIISPWGNWQCVMLTLPQELLEEIVVVLAELDHPTAIAALSQCCRQLRKLVYEPADRFLWRRIFLTAFDDARVALSGNELHSFDWSHAYRARAHVRLVIEATQAPLHSLPPDYSWTAVLRALLDIIDTSLPIRPTSDVSEEVDTPAASHELEKLYLLPLVQVNTRAPLYPPSLAPSAPSDNALLPSKNIAWLERTLDSGLPKPLLRRFVNALPGDSWMTSEEGKAFCRIVACLGARIVLGGFRVQVDAPSTTNAGEEAAKNFATDLSNVLYQSQKRVYDMRYPVSSRAWGPYRAVEEEDGGRTEGSSVGVMTASAADGLIGDGATNSHDSVGENSDIPDLRVEAADHNENSVGSGGDDLIGSLTESTASSTSGEESSPDEASFDEDDTSGSEAEDDTGGVVLDHEPGDSSRLYPDWEHLAAIRVVVQARLQEVRAGDIDLVNLMNIHTIRRGVWRVDHAAVSEGERLMYGGRTEWDWAGVEGVWRRAVCWLGYGSLIRQNRAGFSNKEDFDEQYIIVLAVLRIAKYTPCPIPRYADRPTIHFEGRMAAEPWEDGTAYRNVKGTVSVIADGSVRWSFISTTEDRDEWEWTGEGVQFGSGDGSRAGCGVLGLWTGWEHTILDPVGAWWQWRVY